MYITYYNIYIYPYPLHSHNIPFYLHICFCFPTFVFNLQVWTPHLDTARRLQSPDLQCAAIATADHLKKPPGEVDFMGELHEIQGKMTHGIGIGPRVSPMNTGM